MATLHSYTYELWFLGSGVVHIDFGLLASQKRHKLVGDIIPIHARIVRHKNCSIVGRFCQGDITTQSNNRPCLFDEIRVRPPYYKVAMVA